MPRHCLNARRIWARTPQIADYTDYTDYADFKSIRVCSGAILRRTRPNATCIIAPLTLVDSLG